MSEEQNSRIGDYQILNELGSGGMGRVYRVRNVISDRIEAMKVLLPDLAGRQELAARFLREIKLMGSLNHPNIAALRTAFTYDNQLIMVMEYVEGTTIAKLLEKGPLPAADAVNYIGQALDALAYAHAQHVIHRDIKPANMMVTPEGVVKLMDFGIARAGDEHTLTMTGTTLGSLGYMSPEQVKGESTDVRSDLYSVGVSLYEMVTGQRPFRAESDYAIMAAHVKETPTAPVELRPDLPQALNDIIFMAIEKDPTKRFQTAAAFRNALNSVKIAPAAAPQKSASGATTVDTLIPATAATLPAMPVTTPVPQPAPIPAIIADTPSIPIPPPQPSSHRGLYMTLGALVVLVGLVFAGIYMPRRGKAAKAAPPAPSMEGLTPAASMAPAAPASPAPSLEPAGSMAAPAPVASGSAPATVATPAAVASPAPPASPASVAAPAAPQTGISNAAERMPAIPKPSAQRLSAHSSVSSQLTGSTAAMQAPSAPATKTAAETDEVENQIDQLSSRAGAVDVGLERLQQQQAAAGYGLRGDMAAHQASMRNNLAKAQAAMERGDLERAKRYRDLAQGDIEALEKFLGR